MKKQLLAVMLSFAFASAALLPSASAAEQIAQRVDYATKDVVVTGTSNYPVVVNPPPANQTPSRGDGPVFKGPIQKKKPVEIKKHKPKKSRPVISSQQTKKPKIDLPKKGRQGMKQKPTYRLPKTSNPTPGTIPSGKTPGNTQGRTKVHGPHWCYGACSLHDAGLHNAPRTQKHWCDGYR